MAERRWSLVYEELTRADAASALPAQDLELLATSAFLCGRRDVGRRARLRAYQLYASAGEMRRAARCGAHLGVDAISTGEIAQAAGCLPASMSSCSAWVAHASSLLEQEPDCPERGFVLVSQAYEQLVMKEDVEAAERLAADAVALGRRFDDLDVTAWGLTVGGRSHVRAGRVLEGMAMLDEAVTVATSHGPSPVTAGVVLASATDASEEAFDPARLDEWSGAFAAWCDVQAGMVAFRSRALMHLATRSQLLGRWDDALEFASRAADGPIARADPQAAAAAAYRRGEVFRLRGQISLAAAAFAQAHEMGLDPQPGMALLRHAEGRTDAAMHALNRVHHESPNDLRRVHVLAAKLEVLLDSADLHGAEACVEEQQALAGRHGSPGLEAMAHQAKGAILLAAGHGRTALDHLRRAAHVWRHLGLLHEEGRCRMLLGRAMLLVGDADSAALELGTACRILAGLGAQPDLGRHADVLAEPSGRGSAYRLTPRELEVLRLLAEGWTNRAIANELTVTVRTVDSHVGSILAKLGVANRSAAAALAHRHQML